MVQVPRRHRLEPTHLILARRSHRTLVVQLRLLGDRVAHNSGRRPFVLRVARRIMAYHRKACDNVLVDADDELVIAATDRRLTRVRARRTVERNLALLQHPAVRVATIRQRDLNDVPYLRTAATHPPGAPNASQAACI